jgi:hypothetical protein
VKKKAKVILGIVLTVLGIIAVGYVALYLTLAQAFSNPMLAVVPSPKVPEDEVWLLEWGFQDRGISLFVKSPLLNGGKPKRITPLDWDGLYSFKQLRFSDDGRLAVFSLRLAGGDRPEIAAFAFDFSTGKAILPPWQGENTTSRKTPEEWKHSRERVAALAAAHGGLTDHGLAREDFMNCSRKIWFWQVP